MATELLQHYGVNGPQDHIDKCLTKQAPERTQLHLSSSKAVVESLSVLNRAAVPVRPGIFGREP